MKDTGAVSRQRTSKYTVALEAPGQSHVANTILYPLSPCMPPPPSLSPSFLLSLPPSSGLCPCPTGCCRSWRSPRAMGGRTTAWRLTQWGVAPAARQSSPSLQVASPSLQVAPPTVQVAPPSVQVAPPSLQVAPPSLQVAPPTLHIAPPSRCVAITLASVQDGPQCVV